MMTTFIPCGAKLPIIALIVTALFGNAWWVAPSAYFIGIAAIVCFGIFLEYMAVYGKSRTFCHGTASLSYAYRQQCSSEHVEAWSVL